MNTITIYGENRYEKHTKERVACRGIIIKDGQILLSYEENTDQWFIPGGGIEGNETKAEFLLPEVVGSMIRENKAEIKVLTSNDRWFGVTYKEDKDLVVRSFRELYEKGQYPEQLFR